MGLVDHDVRLDILCCLDGDGPLTATAVSARVGRSTEVVVCFLLLLRSYGVVRTTGEREGGEPLYEARLDDQPAWVRAAVEAHRAREV